MIGLMILLVFVGLILHLNPSERDLALKMKVRLMRLLVNMSIAIFIPALIERTFGEVSKYDFFIFHPFFMFPIGAIFAIGLQLLICGKLES
ncbi:hypothetical protein [Fusibacter tunisiensis]|uniref:Uncharacterized protein n=1 Tax=Fusibacter tunisiensis TaxID=1008308 RepID=A0ABS2MU56_9FIRM|nr:hypothetical protein [Fusibacter tunisiensis]MBM7562885.1 hypothetical protein [Fusibacter tunisiensis]